MLRGTERGTERLTNRNGSVYRELWHERTPPLSRSGGRAGASRARPKPALLESMGAKGDGHGNPFGQTSRFVIEDRQGDIIMRHRGIAAALVLGGCLTAGTAYGQDYGCQVGMPSSPRPGPTWVPTLDCQGWVPPDHPIAREPVAPTIIDTVPAAIAQDIYTRIEYPPAMVYGSISQVSGFAVDCRLGSYPPILHLIETKPDGSTREIPLTFYYEPGQPRGDVQTLFRDVCPAVLNVPSTDGRGLEPNDRFGFRVLLQSPISERGLHIFTAQYSWPGQGHAGSSSVSVTIR